MDRESIATIKPGHDEKLLPLPPVHTSPRGRPSGDPFLDSRMRTMQLIENKSSSAYIVSFLLWAGGVKTSGAFKLFQTLFFFADSHSKKKKKAVWPRETTIF